MRAKVDHVTDCVFLPAHAISRVGYTQFLRWSGWEWSMQGRFSREPTALIMSEFHCVCFAPGRGKTLFEEGVFTCVLAAPATLPLRRSSGCARRCIVLPPGTLRGVCPRLWSRGPAAAEAPRRLRSRGSHIDLADGLEMGSPYFHLYSPGLVLSRGGSLSCSSSPLSESALICSSFSPRRFICFVPSGSRVAEAMRALWSFSVYLWTFHFRPCLLVWVFDCI